MSLNIALPDLRSSVRKFANVQGTSALLRHPDLDINDYVNRALGSLQRMLTAAMPDQRFLSSTILTTQAGVAVYTLPADFDFLISIEMTADGRRRWLQAYEMPERAALTDPNVPTAGIPLTYRLRGSVIEFLPVPADVYSPLLWYVPSAVQLANADSYDTISRLDDYIVAYAARLVAIKDKNWDLVNNGCAPILAELKPEIAQIGRNRDRNSPPRIVDQFGADRWGRSSTRRWR